MELAAQAWCRPEVSDRVMDVELAKVFAEILDEQLGSDPGSVAMWHALEQRKRQRGSAGRGDNNG